MFSLALRLFRLGLYLFAFTVALVLVLNFKIVYKGGGDFTVVAKDRWSFSGSFVDASGDLDRLARSDLARRAAGRAGQVSAAVRHGLRRFEHGLNRISGGTAPQAVNPARIAGPQPVPGGIASGAAASSDRTTAGKAECLRLRKLIADAVDSCEKADHGPRMKELDLFALLSAGFLHELPNCPSGGEFTLSRDSSGRAVIGCTIHGH